MTPFPFLKNHGARIFVSILLLFVLVFVPVQVRSSGVVGSDTINTVAGINGTIGSSPFIGDGGPATEARNGFVSGVAVDSSGNIYIVDRSNRTIRKVNASTGIITTIAGTGASGFSGDGGPATSAVFSTDLRDIDVDGSGNVYINDKGNLRIRKIDTGGTITTVAGSGLSGNSGDGGAAVNAKLNSPEGIAVSPEGDVYIADTNNYAVRRVNSSTGIITTVAGTNGIPNHGGGSGDGGLATEASFGWISNVEIDSVGNLFIVDRSNRKIRKVGTNSVITHVAGSGVTGSSGDGGSALNASFSGSMRDVAVDVAGNFYIDDYGNQKIRKVDTSGTVDTVAGIGSIGNSGDGGPANEAKVGSPEDIHVGPSGALFIADTNNKAIRKVAPAAAPVAPPAPPAPPPATKIGGPTAHRPQVKITSPERGDVKGGIVNIEYEAIDLNDRDSISIRSRLGFGENPVSVFYGDRGQDTRRKKLIAEGLSATGPYKWDTRELFDDEKYVVIVEAIDNSKEKGEAVSGTFSIDNSPPIFKVRTDPSFTQGEDVTIIVEPSESLIKSPVVYVTQKGFERTKIDVRKVARGFEGVYQVVSGYDGPAFIEVDARDLAGNSGDTIVSGGSFSVGVLPPPQPTITSPSDRDVFTSKTITVRGNARGDTTVILKVNGDKEYIERPDKDGNFVFRGVVIDPNFNRGINFLNVASRDDAGNLSEEATVTAKFNTEPKLEIFSPVADEIIDSVFAVEVDARDINRDKLLFTYEASSDGGFSWTILAEGLDSDEYIWDTSGFSNGEYVLRVTADDGLLKNTVLSDIFVLRNSSPTISFTGGRREIVSTRNVRIEGRAISPKRPQQSPFITSIEYSRDKGTTWLKLEALDGVFNSDEERFQIDIPGLNEGENEILFRISDSRGLLGMVTKVLVVDFGPPPPPVIESPKPSSIVDESDDENENLAGVQITVSGTAEPGARVNVTILDSEYSSRVSSEGKFAVPNVTLAKHGINTIRVFLTDEADNKSDEETISVVYNNPPLVRILRPRLGGGINNKAEILFQIRDDDLDEITDKTLSFRRKGDAEWTLLSDRLGRDRYSWDVSGFEDGTYELLLVASDGNVDSSETRTFFIDNSEPTIKVNPLHQRSFNRTFTLSVTGEAEDNFSGIAFVEYSLDGEHWFKASITSGLGENNSRFRVRHPYDLEDGEYNIKFRATDSASNVSESVSEEVLVDMTPPRVGSFIIKRGNINLFPEGDSFFIPAKTLLSFLISLEVDTERASLFLEDREIDLRKNRATALWETDLFISTVGEFPLFISAEDALENKTERRQVGTVQSTRKGRVISDAGLPVQGAELTAFVFNEDDNTWSKWQGEPYGEKNPTMSNEQGEYVFLLPSGRYYIIARKEGFENIKSSPFEISSSRLVAFNFTLQQREGVRGFFEDFFERVNFLF